MLLDVSVFWHGQTTSSNIQVVVTFFYLIIIFLILNALLLTIYFYFLFCSLKNGHNKIIIIRSLKYIKM